MATSRTTPTTIDEYISGFSPDVQAILQKIRQVVRSAAPDAQETISYQIPAFKLNGVIVYFAAFKKHIGFYPPIRDDAQLQKAISPYAGPKGNPPVSTGSTDSLRSHRTHCEASPEAELGEGRSERQEGS